MQTTDLSQGSYSYHYVRMGSKGTGTSICRGTAPMLGRGSLVLARELHDRIAERRGVQEACNYLADLLVLLFPGHTIGIEVKLQPADTPIFVGKATHKGSESDVIIEHRPESQVLAKLRISRNDQDVRPLSDYDMLFLELALHFLGGRVDSWQERSRRLMTLTAMESQVLSLLRDSNQNIMEALHIEKSTLDSHMRAIFRKLDVHRRQDAVAWASEWQPDAHANTDQLPS